MVSGERLERDGARRLSLTTLPAAREAVNLSNGFVDRLTALNPWLASADWRDIGARAGHVNAERLAEGGAGWGGWSGEMTELASEAAKADERGLFETVAAVDLSNAREPLDLVARLFPGALRISGRNLSRGAIEGCRIVGDLTVEDVQVEGWLSLQSTEILGALRIGRSRLAGRIDFAGIVVQGAASFERVTFEGDVWHQRAVFRGPASWVDVDFKSDAGFHTAVFEGPTRFERVNFFDTTSFESTRFGAAGASAAVAFYRKCSAAGATGALPTFLIQPDGPSGAGAGNVRRLPTRRGGRDRKDAG